MIDFDALVLVPSMATFGETNQGFPAVVYTPANGSPYSVSGIFDPSYKEIKFGRDGEPVTVTMPVLGVKLSDFVLLPKQGDGIQARGTNYVIREVRVDGHGGAKLMLNSTVLE